MQGRAEACCRGLHQLVTLYVLDGIAEGINILKGQAASALYGMRASNGVIIITTKKGSSVQKGAPRVTFTTNLSFDKVSVLPDFQTKYAQGSAGRFSPTSSTSWGPKLSDLADDPDYGG